jgi:hypothetical protein
VRRQQQHGVGWDREVGGPGVSATLEFIIISSTSRRR